MLFRSCRSKGHEKRDEDGDKSQRNHNRQSGGGRLQILELSAPFEIVASRQLHLRDLRLRFLDERACIAPFQVQLDNKNGRTTCRERGCTSVLISVVTV